LGKRLLASSWVRSLIGYLTARYVTLVKATTKWQFANGHHLTDQLAGGSGLIIITWHSRLMMIPAGWPGAKPLHILVSRHGDGDLVGRVMVHFGMVMVRGSTHRPDRNYEADREKGGSAALRQLLALLKDGQVIGLTPDGPRGPAGGDYHRPSSPPAKLGPFSHRPAIFQGRHDLWRTDRHSARS
jgi:hypothetical protein